ncbi:MAG TPA: CRISPR-associated endonuclease Cas2 [Thermoanaerobaculia bacterium]
MDWGRSRCSDECQLDEKQIARLRARVSKLIEPQEDNVRIYRLCGECAARIEIVGVGQVTEDPQVFVV